METLQADQDGQGCKEARVLQERIAQVDAAWKLGNVDIQTFKKQELQQILGILRSQTSLIPLPIKTSIMSRAMPWRFQNIMEHKDPDFKQFFLDVGFWLGGALEDFTDASTAIGPGSIASPSLLPLMFDLVKTDERMITSMELDFEDEDEANKKISGERAEMWEAGLNQTKVVKAVTN